MNVVLGTLSITFIDMGHQYCSVDKFKAHKDGIQYNSSKSETASWVLIFKVGI